MLAIIDFRADEEIVLNLENLGFKVIKMKGFEALPKPVFAHPDMLMFIDGDTLFTHTDYYKVAREELDLIAREKNLKIVVSNEKIGDKYPLDVLFNAVLLEGFLITNLNTVSEHIKDFAVNNSIKIINVKQGYTKCSVLKVCDNAIITADEGIYNAVLGEEKIDALKISENFADLDGYAYGFIGGASGLFGDSVYFSGDITLHPDYKSILAFCQKHGKKIISLKKNSRLYDLGTLTFI